MVNNLTSKDFIAIGLFVILGLLLVSLTYYPLFWDSTTAFLYCDDVAQEDYGLIHPVCDYTFNQCHCWNSNVSKRSYTWEDKQGGVKFYLK